MLRNWRWFVFGAVILLLGWGIWSLNSAKNDYQAQEVSMTAQLAKLHEQNISLQNELDSLKNPQNLINILKSQTNYVQQGEKLIIITAPNATSSTSTATSTN
jgi:cell division protein FtsB